MGGYHIEERRLLLGFRRQFDRFLHFIKFFVKKKESIRRNRMISIIC